MFQKAAGAAIKLTAVTVLLAALATAQSGRGSMRGYVMFEGVSYVEVAEKKIHAKVELLDTKQHKPVYTTETDEHGSYDFGTTSLGEFVLRISSPGFKTYQTEILIPSDFMGNLATMLKKESHKSRKSS